jgi:hypothetical protein
VVVGYSTKNKKINMVNSFPSQEILQIDEIRDGVLILKNKTMRVVLMASSVNIALKSADEQTAIIMQYQNFLNSLDFTTQIFMRSRKLDIEPYLDTLREAQKIQTNELLKIQIAEYIDFVRTFVKASNIVAKSFYVVVPFTPPFFESPQEGVKAILEGLFKSKDKGFRRI